MKWLGFTYLLITALPCMSQSVYLSRFVPGNYLADNLHTVEITNASGELIDLAGYLLVTRDYSMRFPSGSRVAPYRNFRVGKINDATQTFDAQLSKTFDFLIRFNLLENEGNYVCLFDPYGKAVDAFYYSPLSNVPFLPDRDTLISYSGSRIPFYLPPENRAIWSYLQVDDRPGIEFLRPNGKWTLEGGEEDRPVADFQDFSARYYDGIVTLKWSTSFEEESLSHVVERSLDQKNFAALKSIPAKDPSGEFQYYAFYDSDIEADQIYYYRIRAEKKPSSTTFSQIRSVQALEGLKEFAMEALLIPQGDYQQLNLRFTSQYSQNVRIKLLNAQMGEVAILFDDYVFAESPNLLKIGKPLPAGQYTVLAITQTKRYGTQIEVP